MPKADFLEIQKKLGLKFKNVALLRQAFVHRSYLNENVRFELDHNERLEFLGDAVLELVVTEHLYREYPNPEGELTNWRSALVKGETLARIAKTLGLGDYLFLSKGEEKSGGKARQIILANTIEALIGALYMDQGFKPSQKFIKAYILSELPEILEKKLYLDAKSRLQEIMQAEHEVTPAYRVIAEYGPDHAKNFTIGVYQGDILVGEGSGSSKQAAEQAAASNALENINE